MATIQFMRHDLSELRGLHERIREITTGTPKAPEEPAVPEQEMVSEEHHDSAPAAIKSNNEFVNKIHQKNFTVYGELEWKKLEAHLVSLGLGPDKVNKIMRSTVLNRGLTVDNKSATAENFIKWSRSKDSGFMAFVKSIRGDAK